MGVTWGDRRPVQMSPLRRALSRLAEFAAPREDTPPGSPVARDTRKDKP